MSATTTTTTAAQTTMRSTTESSVFSMTTVSLREISAAPVYENSNDAQLNGVDNSNSLSDIDDVLEYVEAAIDESGSEKSPSAVMETARACAK